jgi:serine/threonine-protein kinase TNNI3K
MAMDFLHAMVPPVVHRDMKSPNILLTVDEEGLLRAKVSDFGLSRSMTLTGEFGTCYRLFV